MQRNNSGQSGHATNKSAQIVIGARCDYLDWQLNIEFAFLLRLKIDHSDLQSIQQPFIGDIF